MEALEMMPKALSCNDLKELWLHVIFNCNLKCQHCLFSCGPEKEGPGQLILEECREYVVDAIKKGTKAVYITGGEPLLWPHLWSLLEWYYGLPEYLPLTILTNGTLIGPLEAERLREYGQKGLNLRISLECYTPQTHDQYRGEGNFALAIRAIGNLNEVDVYPWVAYVNKSGGALAEDAAASLENDFKHRLKDDYGVEIAGLKIISAYSKGRFTGRVNPQICSEKAMDKLLRVQCTYGLTVSKKGISPCPILVDIPHANMGSSLAEALGKDFTVEYDFCRSCFATGTSCGQ